MHGLRGSVGARRGKRRPGGAWEGPAVSVWIVPVSLLFDGMRGVWRGGNWQRWEAIWSGKAARLIGLRCDPLEVAVMSVHIDGRPFVEFARGKPSVFLLAGGDFWRNAPGALVKPDVSILVKTTGRTCRSVVALLSGDE